MTDPIWEIDLGEGPLVATAIHDGAAVRDDVLRHMVISASDRRREEDPFTGEWTHLLPSWIVSLRSRFEIDLNRPRDQAVYRVPGDCWGLEVWDGPVADGLATESLREYDAFYATLKDFYGGLESEYGTFVVFDLHTYNHRRDGPGAPPADESLNPQINVGTGTMANRARWARLIDRFIEELGTCSFPGGRLDVRENVKFRGGQHPRWTHENFPDAACVLSIEVKKFFMDEWTGEADPSLVEVLGHTLASTVPGVLEELARL